MRTAAAAAKLPDMPFDAVLFDAGGVLVVPDTSVTGPVVARFSGTDDPEVLIRAHFAGVYALDHSDVEHEDWAAYHRGYAAEAGVPPELVDEAGDTLRTTMEHAHWRMPFPGAVEALRALHERGVTIGVVSNAAGQIEQTLIDEAICHVRAGGDGSIPVACVIDSHVVGVAKPDPAIFTHALPILGLDPSEDIAYVGDTVFNDVRAAAAAGLTPLLHDPYGFHAGGPHRTIARLADLVDLV